MGGEQELGRGAVCTANSASAVVEKPQATGNKASILCQTNASANGKSEGLGGKTVRLRLVAQSRPASC